MKTENQTNRKHFYADQVRSGPLSPTHIQSPTHSSTPSNLSEQSHNPLARTTKTHQMYHSKIQSLTPSNQFQLHKEQKNSFFFLEIYLLDDKKKRVNQESKNPVNVVEFQTQTKGEWETVVRWWRMVNLLYFYYTSWQ